MLGRDPGNPSAVPPPPPPTSKAAGAAAPRTSVLAIVAFIASILVVVPCVAPVAAMILGGVALKRIQRSGGAMLGTRLAVIAVLLGGVVLIGQGVALQWLGTSLMSRHDTALRSSVEAVLAVDGEDAGQPALAGWSQTPADRVTAAEIETFARTARERYGPLKSVATVSEEPGRDSTLMRQSLTAAVVFRFSSGERTGTVVSLLVPTERSVLPETRLASVVIDDRERGALRLGPQPAAEAEKGGDHGQ